MCVFSEKRDSQEHAENAFGLCLRRHDGRVRMVAFNPGDGSVGVDGKLAFFPAAVGFLLGIAFLLLLDRTVPHLHMDCEEPEGPACALRKTTMLILAVTLHNIPEGMAVGVMFAGMLAENSGITLAAALALSIGIAIQNFPEGAIISLPLKSEGLGSGRAFFDGTLSGVVEPIAAGITVLLYRLVEPVLPYLLAFAAEP